MERNLIPDTAAELDDEDKEAEDMMKG